jgi:hypothetical protein
MSRDLKYIGMDVHKEAVVIAVRNGTGQLVMESIVETKASSLVQFIHGLQGELHVTWEEGTWASLALRPAEATCARSFGLQSAT